MNRKQFAILVVLLIILGGAGWYVQMNRDRTGSAGEQGTGQKLLGDSFPVNDVVHISVRQGTNELNLVKKEDLWRVRERNDYPANFSEISEFLIKARDLKVVQSEEVGPSQLPRLQLSATGQGTNGGVVLDLKNKDDKPLFTVTLGKKHMRKPAQQQAMQFGEEGFPDGRYVMLAKNNKQALLISDPLDNIQPKPENWLNKDFFKVERPKAITVTFPEATNSWKLVRNTESGDWKFAQSKPDEKLDAAKVSPLSNPFSTPSFEDVVLAGSTPGGTGLDKPTIVTIDTFDDFTYTVKVGKKAGENYPVTMMVAANFPKERIPAKDEKPEDKTKADKAWADRQKQLAETLKHNQTFENWTYLVPGWNVDPVLKERKDLLVEKKEEPKPAESPAPAAENKVPAAPAATAQKN
jgi:hypothetical protein